MNVCECVDAGCPVHKRQAQCTGKASVILFRCDMEDRTGTAFCAACADDALQSGVFTDGKHEGDDEDVEDR